MDSIYILTIKYLFFDIRYLKNIQIIDIQFLFNLKKNTSKILKRRHIDILMNT